MKKRKDKELLLQLNAFRVMESKRETSLPEAVTITLPFIRVMTIETCIYFPLAGLPAALANFSDIDCTT